MPYYAPLPRLIVTTAERPKHLTPFALDCPSLNSAGLAAIDSTANDPHTPAAEREDITSQFEAALDRARILEANVWDQWNPDPRYKPTEPFPYAPTVKTCSQYHYNQDQHARALAHCLERVEKAKAIIEKIEAREYAEDNWEKHSAARLRALELCARYSIRADVARLSFQVCVAKTWKWKTEQAREEAHAYRYDY